MIRPILTDKYMSNTRSVRRFLEMKREDITALNLFILMCSGRSEMFPSRDAWIQALSHAYGMQCGWRLTGFGRQVLVEFVSSWLDENLVQTEGYEKEIQTIFKQGLHHPVFTEETLQEAKYLLQTRHRGIVQNPEAYAVRTALINAGPGTDIAIPINGFAEDIDKVTLQDIQNLFEKISKADTVDLYIGREDSALVSDQVPKLPSYIDKGEPIPEQETVYFQEHRDIAQSALAQVYSTGISFHDPEYIALAMMNELLGGSSASMLFEIVREQHSLCYSISSTLIRFDGALCISTGCDAKNLEKVKELIALCIQKIKDMDYDPEWFELVRNEALDTITASYDSAAGEIETQFMYITADRVPDLESRLERIESITMEQLADVAKRLQLVSQSEIIQNRESDGEGFEEFETLEEEEFL